MVNEKRILIDVLKKHSNHTKWTDALFGHIKILANTKVGSVGEDFVEELCTQLRMSCEFPANKRGERSKQSPWDIKINEVEFEIKTATEDVSGNFQFNHIRYHRAYDAVVCIGISPDNILFGVWSKSEISTNKAGTLVSMEKGANASYKLTKKASDLFPIFEFNDRILSLISQLSN